MVTSCPAIVNYGGAFLAIPRGNWGGWRYREKAQARLSGDNVVLWPSRPVAAGKPHFGLSRLWGGGPVSSVSILRVALPRQQLAD
jgi:hypothetical protein